MGRDRIEWIFINTYCTVHLFPILQRSRTLLIILSAEQRVLDNPDVWSLCIINASVHFYTNIVDEAWYFFIENIYFQWNLSGGILILELICPLIQKKTEKLVGKKSSAAK